MQLSNNDNRINNNNNNYLLILLSLSSLLLLLLRMMMCCSNFFLFLLVVVAAAVAVNCLFVCMFFSLFAKLVLFRFLSWFSISLTCFIYIHIIFFFRAVVLSSTNIFYYISVKAQCHFF